MGYNLYYIKYQSNEFYNITIWFFQKNITIWQFLKNKNYMVKSFVSSNIYGKELLSNVIIPAYYNLILYSIKKNII